MTGSDDSDFYPVVRLDMPRDALTPTTVTPHGPTGVVTTAARGQGRGALVLGCRYRAQVFMCSDVQRRDVGSGATSGYNGRGVALAEELLGVLVRRRHLRLPT
ncbi:hypothetical protein [Mycobacterium decipiens]|uniref:Uncharacterized protein n=1 Tax=Mycobacterium decipiens TaxID=1430326 RepID=A0A1X2LVB0_9MYCO|nr:hypothetical protein [Mycobacterium decipiens]OSC40974.1 hypothetical protein B8W66_10985 [Mycobacterium decipiens]